MKKMKSKIATALVLGAISFGMFSFTTTPINAQSTASRVSVTENEAEAALASFLVRSALKGAALALGYIVGESLIGNQQVSEYPGDSLD